MSFTSKSYLVYFVDANELVKWLFLCYILAFRNKMGKLLAVEGVGGKDKETAKAKEKIQSELNSEQMKFHKN